MIKVIVKSNTTRREIIAEVSDTPASVFDNAEVGTDGSMMNINGTILHAADLHSPFSALGVADGTTINLNSVVKADGAC